MPRMLSRTVPVLFLAGVASIVLLPARATARDVLERFDLEVTGGKRVDQLDWNIAGNFDGNNYIPNILSELTWKDLESDQVSARAKMIMVNERFPFVGMFRAEGSYGEINSGTNQDSDFNGDYRTREYSRSNNQADQGDVWDASLGGGVVFFNHSRTFSVAPMVGFSTHRQNLSMHDGYQTISDPAKAPFKLHPYLQPLGPIVGLDATYETEWRSGWFGIDMDYNPSLFFDLHATAEFHAGDYEAEADWNLRDDMEHPRSFRHTSDKAVGVVARVGMRAGLPNVFLTVDYQYQKWRADEGQDRTYNSNGTIGYNRLNEVNWEASSINGGVTVRF